MTRQKLHSLLSIFAILVSTLALSSPAKENVSVPKPNPNLDLARQLNQAFVQVAEEVSPSVVVITVTQKTTESPFKLPPGQEQNDGEDPLDRVPPEFRKFFRQSPQEKSTGQGSGVIIREDGFILTNRHVVEDAEKIEVRLKDGRTFQAEVRGVDAPSDVAVIKINTQSLPVARLADSSKTRVGEFAIAIGAPFALDYTVTFGHVSAKDRSNIVMPDPESPTMTDQSFIQTDANINPGNSGGPLVNIDGEVIGINTLIRGLHTGIGFAVPSNLAREVADKLITDGKFTRAWLGVSIRSFREYPEYREFVPGIQDGVVVTEILPSGPAAKSELKPGDVVTAVDGKAVVTSQQLKDAVRGKTIGQNVKLDVVRQGDSPKDIQRLKVIVKPGEYEDKNVLVASNETYPKIDSSSGTLGLKVQAVTRDLAEHYNVNATEGLIVTSVDKTGLAARNGIRVGDVITSINQHRVSDPKEFRELIKNLDTKRGVIVNLISEGAAKFEILKEGDD
ncbi:trypsin-like peptidase domain-containing protein [Pedosphaera parvula]|nr:trypsin-like peptidase domain-containing protein [Pedosphaera parvula]